MLGSLRKIALLSFTAMATLAIAPVVGKTLVSSAAFAKDGNHESRGGEGGHSGGGGHDGSGHDSSGRGHDGGDDGASSGSDSDDSADDGDDDSAGTHEDNGRRRHGNETAREHANEHSRVALSVSDSELEGLKNGSLKAVDSQGRTLEVEIEKEHGTVKVEVKLHGDDDTGEAITGVKVVPAS